MTGTGQWPMWIGRQVSREDLVTPRLAAEFRATLGPHLFEPADGLPPGFHWGLAPPIPAAGELGPDGSEAKGLFLPPIPLSRRMWAGGQVSSLAPIRIGARITRVSTIAGIEDREGASGPLCFVSITHDIAADGIPAVRERQDLVFREASVTAPATPAAATPLDGLRWTVAAPATLLFRFSAFTFNGHRIHYDESFARSEGHPGLLVHGPLQAALMLNQTAAALGHVPQRFDYRCVAPLASGPDFIVSTRSDLTGTLSRVTGSDGVTTAEARVPAPGT